MRILITGNRGQLGRDAMEVFGAVHPVRGVDIDELDIADPRAVDALLEEFRPRQILNCAAFTQVDACESRRREAWTANAEGPRNLARAAAACGARLVHISTDYVFDGRRPPPEPYRESDPPNPDSEYGRSKLAGEQAVLAAEGPGTVVRTAWLYGAAGGNFLKTMLRLALADPHRVIRVVDDQYGCPTWSRRLALQLLRLMEGDGRGVYHATGEGHCTWYELARHFLERIDVPHRLEPCTTAEYPTPARRPANSILENGRLKAEGIHLMEPWQADVDAFVDRWGRQILEEAGSKS